MACPHTPKPATAPHGKPASNVEQLPCELNSNLSDAASANQECSTLELQIFCLAHRLAISAPMAASLAAVSLREPAIMNQHVKTPQAISPLAVTDPKIRWEWGRRGGRPTTTPYRPRQLGEQHDRRGSTRD